MREQVSIASRRKSYAHIPLVKEEGRETYTNIILVSNLM
jgi:hypothetical protein